VCIGLRAHHRRAVALDDVSTDIIVAVSLAVCCLIFCLLATGCKINTRIGSFVVETPNMTLITKCGFKLLKNTDEHTVTVNIPKKV